MTQNRIYAPLPINPRFHGCVELCGQFLTRAINTIISV